MCKVFLVAVLFPSIVSAQTATLTGLGTFQLTKINSTEYQYIDLSADKSSNPHTDGRQVMILRATLTKIIDHAEDPKDNVTRWVVDLRATVGGDQFLQWRTMKLSSIVHFGKEVQNEAAKNVSPGVIAQVHF